MPAAAARGSQWGPFALRRFVNAEFGSREKGKARWEVTGQWRKEHAHGILSQAGHSKWSGPVQGVCPRSPAGCHSTCSVADCTGASVLIFQQSNTEVLICMRTQSLRRFLSLQVAAAQSACGRYL